MAAVGSCGCCRPARLSTHGPPGRRVAAGAKGTSRRSQPRGERASYTGPAIGPQPASGPQIKPTMMDLTGPTPDLPSPTREELRKEGLLDKDGGVPEWIKGMKEAADAGDTGYQQILAGTNLDPVKVIENINADLRARREEMNNPERPPSDAAGDEIRVRFREVQHFNLWIWVQLCDTPTAKEKELVSEVFKAWFTLGRLSGFNAMNLQVADTPTHDTSYLDYNHEQLESGLTAGMHEMSELQWNGQWCRLWIDCGTADEMALDILINAFNGFSREHCPIRDLVIGGENEDWPVPELEMQDAQTEGGAVPKGVDLRQFGVDPDLDLGGDSGYDEEEVFDADEIERYLGEQNLDFHKGDSDFEQDF